MEVYISLGLLSLIVLFLIVRALQVVFNKRHFEQYWQEQLDGKPQKGAINLVALGDSISIGVGATSYKTGLIGRVALYIESQTGRPVYVQNYSRSGATADEVADTQLPKVDLTKADIVLLEIGANDSRKRTPEQYRRDMERIITKLPLEKTVIADLPYVKIRQAYQAELEKILQDKEVIRANMSSVFEFTHSAWGTTAGDFFHPNNKGYELWFEAFKPGIDQILQQNSLRR